ncbi:hypothetical protein ABK040_000996 [Willaertia magna]
MSAQEDRVATKDSYILFHKEEIEREFSKIFDYETLMKDRSKMHIIDDEYFVGASNGFVRIFTIKGKKYWLSQAQVYHRAPDYKIHFSIHYDDIPKAFNILAKHFYLKKCQFGMKAAMTDIVYNKVYQDEDYGWPEHMKGREITLYIYRYYNPNDYYFIREYIGNNSFIKHYLNDKNSEFYKNNLLEYVHYNPFDQYELTLQDEEPLQFYWNFIKEAEQLLEKENIRTNGCAQGDLPLGGKYATFRNETCIICPEKRKDKNVKDIDNLFMYPPNETGWNASGMEDALFIYYSLRQLNDRSLYFTIYFLFLSILLFLFFVMLF